MRKYSENPRQKVNTHGLPRKNSSSQLVISDQTRHTLLDVISRLLFIVRALIKS